LIVSADNFTVDIRGGINTAKKDMVLVNFKTMLGSRLPSLALFNREFLETVCREIRGREVEVDGLFLCSRLLREEPTRWGVMSPLIRSGTFAAKTVRHHPPLEVDRTSVRKAGHVFSGKEKAQKNREIGEAVRRAFPPAPGGHP
jgi:hypothetical protein